MPIAHNKPNIAARTIDFNKGIDLIFGFNFFDARLKQAFNLCSSHHGSYTPFKVCSPAHNRASNFPIRYVFDNLLLIVIFWCQIINTHTCKY